MKPDHAIIDHYISVNLNAWQPVIRARVHIEITYINNQKIKHCFEYVGYCENIEPLTSSTLKCGLSLKFAKIRRGSPTKSAGFENKLLNSPHAKLLESSETTSEK